MSKKLWIIVGIFLVLSIGFVNAYNGDFCTQMHSPCGGGCTSTDFTDMFNGYDFNVDPSGVGDITGWNTSCITSMERTFYNSNFNQDISKWDISKVSNINNMLHGVTLTTDNYNALLNGWSNQTIQSSIIFDAGNSKYSLAGKAGRDILTNTYGWTITDGGLEAPTCTPNWTCSGYSTQCIGSAQEGNQACVNATDLNNCGTTYTRDYSEFAPQHCCNSWGIQCYSYEPCRDDNTQACTDIHECSCYSCWTSQGYYPDVNKSCHYCVENWVPHNTKCINNITTIQYYDGNNCNTTDTLPADNGTTASCTLSTYSPWCYQESATVPYQSHKDGSCALNYSGSYFVDGQYIYINYSMPPGVLSSSIWQVKYGWNPYVHNYTIPSACWHNPLQLRLYSDAYGFSDVSAECFDGTNWTTIDALSIGVSYSGDDTASPSRVFDGNWDTGVCYNKGRWAIGINYMQNDCVASTLYEEAMNWNICVENWVQNSHPSCSDTINNYTITYTDSNNCGTDYITPNDNGTTVNCTNTGNTTNTNGTKLVYSLYDDAQADNIAALWSGCGLSTCHEFTFDTGNYKSFDGNFLGGDQYYILSRKSDTTKNIRGFSAQVKADSLRNGIRFFIGEGGYTLPIWYMVTINKGLTIGDELYTMDNNGTMSLISTLYSPSIRSLISNYYLVPDNIYHNITMYIDESNYLKIIIDGTTIYDINVSSYYTPTSNTIYGFQAQTYQFDYSYASVIHVKDIYDITMPAAPSCTPNWTCSEYQRCDDHYPQLCTAVSDANNCNVNYTGNYSEFTPGNCIVGCWAWYPCQPNNIQYCWRQNYCYNGGCGGTDNPPFRINQTCDYCTPNWTCSGYTDCQLNDLRYCTGVNPDTNDCNESYIGNLSEFAQSCEYNFGNHTIANSTLAEGLVRYYTMNYPDVSDATGNGPHISIHGSVYNFENGTYFTGAGDWAYPINYGTLSGEMFNYSPSKSFTISISTYGNGWSHGANEAPLTKCNANSCSLIFITDTGNDGFNRMCIGGLGLTTSLCDSTSMNSKQWYTHTLVYDASTSIGYLYLDGRLEGSATMNVPATLGDALTQISGADWPAWERDWNGAIKNYLVWERALTAAEVNTTYTTGVGKVGIEGTCTENWVQQNTTCNGNNYTIQYVDQNNCGTTNNLPTDNGTSVSCISNNQNNLIDGLVGYYPLNEASGNAIDLTNHMNLTQQGTVGSIDGGRGPIPIGDTSDYFSSTTMPLTFGYDASSFTISGWVSLNRTNMPDGVNYVVFSTSDSYGDFSARVHIMRDNYTGYSSNSGLDYYLSNAYVTAGNAIGAPVEWNGVGNMTYKLSDNTPIFFAATYDATTHNFSFYINDVYMGSSTNTQAAGSNAGRAFYLGRDVMYPSNYAGGIKWMKNFGVWNRVLSSNEVMNLSTGLVFNGKEFVALPLQTCSESWVQQNTTCDGTSYKINYIDENSCGTYNHLPADNGTAIGCSRLICSQLSQAVNYIYHAPSLNCSITMEQKRLKLVDSSCNPIVNARVNLRNVNNGYITYTNTNANGIADFSTYTGTVASKFEVDYNGAQYSTAAGSFNSGAGVQTEDYNLKVISGDCNPIVNARVNLRNANNGYITYTNTNATGIAVFQVVPNASMKLEVDYNGAQWVSDAKTANVSILVGTDNFRLTLIDSNNNPIVNARINLRNANDGYITYTNTNTTGIAVFQVVPNASMKLEVDYDGAQYSTNVSNTHEQMNVQTKAFSAVITDSNNNSIVNARINLRNANDGYITYTNTNANGIATFQIVPNAQMKLEVDYNGAQYKTNIATISADTQLSVQTEAFSTLLKDSNNNPIVNARINLRNANDGYITYVNTNANGVATFQVVPNALMKLEIDYNGAQYSTNVSNITTNTQIPIQTKAFAVLLKDSNNNPVANARINLRNANDGYITYTNTNANGIATFQIVPNAQMKLEVDYNGAQYKTNIATITTNTQIPIQTVLLSAHLTKTTGNLSNQRVDLLNTNNGYITYTNTNANGIATFQIVPNAQMKLRSTYNSVTWISDLTTGSANVEHAFT